MLRPDMFNGFRMVQGIERDEIAFTPSDGTQPFDLHLTCHWHKKRYDGWRFSRRLHGFHRYTVFAPATEAQAGMSSELKEPFADELQLGEQEGNEPARFLQEAAEEMH
ncbi:unnamed protein product, partial [Mesorhabditis spiculigera]